LRLGIIKLNKYSGLMAFRCAVTNLVLAWISFGNHTQPISMLYTHKEPGIHILGVMFWKD